MGTDIHGWVEYWHEDLEMWISVFRLAPLVSDRNYELFAWLFGVGRRPDIPMRWDFPPIAAGRGLPPDASQEAATDYATDTAKYPGENHGVTWISWREVLSVDWDEQIKDRIVVSQQGSHGITFDVTWRSLFQRTHAPGLPDQAEKLQPGQRWTVGDKIYEVVAMRRRDVREERWETLFRLMEVLASRVEDPDYLRWVVWFND